MKLIDIIEAIRGDFSIIITKKDGTFSDESAIVHHRDAFDVYYKERRKAKAIAMREDLAINAICHDDGKDLLINLVEV